MKTYAKKTLKLFLTFFILFASTTINAKDYYINSLKGKDTNNGTAKSLAWKSISKLNTLKLNAGDHIYLANGSEFSQPILLNSLKGKKSKPIIITNYIADNIFKNQLPFINTKDALNGLLIIDCSYIEIYNLKISATTIDNNNGQINKIPSKRCGVLITTKNTGIYSHISLQNLIIKNVFYEKQGFTRPAKEVRSANGTQNYGWGIRVINTKTKVVLKNIKISNCTVENVSHTGIKLTGKNKSIKNIEISNCTIFQTGGPGIQMSGVHNGHIVNNYVNESGNNNDTRKWGRGSGLWTWGSSDILIEKNHFLNANGPGDSAGAHIDFNCNNIILQYNISANNAGGFCEILGNNYNCAYRYNISINDGHRTKGIEGAFQEGKTLWLSGFNGKGKKRNGPFNSYIYNNTIYTKKDIISKYAIDKASSGAFIANNIFYIEGKSTAVLGDQYKPEKKGTISVKNIVFKNNLYLTATNWPKEVNIQDSNPFFGNPVFQNKGGIKAIDYLPLNKKLIRNKGLEITNIPNDEIGLYLGLKMTKDILGNPIKNTPDIGAIEIQ